MGGGAKQSKRTENRHIKRKREKKGKKKKSKTKRSSKAQDEDVIKPYTAVD